MKDINVLNHTSVNHLPLTGGTVTGVLNTQREINTTGEYRTTSANGVRIVQGGQGLILRNDGTNSYLLLTNQGDEYGNGNNLRPLIIDNATGETQTGHKFTCAGIQVNGIISGTTAVHLETNTGERNIGFTLNGVPQCYMYGKTDNSMGIYDNNAGRTVWQYNAVPAYPMIEYWTHMEPNANNTLNFGSGTRRWSTLYSVNALDTSDKNYKENIEYISDNRVRSKKVTYQDMYNFYKDIELATYNYKGQEHTEFGFIAQDIANKKVGSELALDLEGGYMYSVGSYISSVAGALKQAINKIEVLTGKISDLEAKNIALESRLNVIESKNPTP